MRDTAELMPTLNLFSLNTMTRRKYLRVYLCWLQSTKYSTCHDVQFDW